MVRGFPGASEVFIVHKNLPLVDQLIIFSSANKDSWFAFKFITPNYDVKLIGVEMWWKLKLIFKILSTNNSAFYLLALECIRQQFDALV